MDFISHIIYSYKVVISVCFFVWMRQGSWTLSPICLKFWFGNSEELWEFLAWFNNSKFSDMTLNEKVFFQAKLVFYVFIPIEVYCGNQFCRETKIEKKSFFKIINIDIYFILNQTTLLRVSLGIGHCHLCMRFT